MQKEKRRAERRRSTDEYRRIERARRGEELVSEALPGLLVPVNGALGG